MKDYPTVTANEDLEADLRALVRLSIAEDLRGQVDWTTASMVSEDLRGACGIVPRENGVCAGLATLPWIINEFGADLVETRMIEDGTPLVVGEPIAVIRGNVRDLLTAERTILNIVSRLCGIATMTRDYVDQIRETSVRLYDTRKTTPGWRLLEKYAVHCGGANNHRSGLHDGFLIKDNHLALAGDGKQSLSAFDAAKRAIAMRDSDPAKMPTIVEIEVDSIAQFRDVIPAGPDIVLLDNFSLEQLCEAVAIRDESESSIELEASGNVRIDTLAAIAATGVDRISSGALTHQATSLDLGLDWSSSFAT